MPLSGRYSAAQASNSPIASCPPFFCAFVASMTLRYAEGDFVCQECGSTRMEYDEALRGGFLSGFFSSFGVAPSGSGFPRLRITRGFPFTRRVGVGGFPAAGQQILIAGTPWGSALPTRYTGSGSGFLVPGFGFWFSVRGCRCCFLFARGRGRSFVSRD